MLVAWYDQWKPGTRQKERLEVRDRTWRTKAEGSPQRRQTQEQIDVRLARLRARYVMGEDGYLRDLHAEAAGHLVALGVPSGAPTDEAGAAVGSVPCRLWMHCDDRLRREVQAGRGGAKAPDAAEGAFLLDQVLVQDAIWEFTHASATDGSRMWVEGVWEVGRGAVMHDGTHVHLIGGAMLDVEANFDQHSFEAELDAMADVAAAVRADALRRWGGGGRWLNITDSLSGAQASQGYHAKSDSARSACYRFGRLSGLEIVQSGFEAGVQMWVHSHGKAGGFSVNEVADLLASEFRSSGRVDPGVRPPPLHVCAFIEEVKRSQCKWMLDALQVYCLERLLARSHFTLRPEATWVEFLNDPVRTKVLPSQEAYELFTDAQASRVAGLVGDRGPDRGLNGRHSYVEWLRRRPCACGASDCDKSVDSVLFRCGLCTEARAGLRSGMAAFASSCDPAYTGMGGWDAACMLLRGLTDVSPGQRLAARRLLLALPHAPPLNNVGVPIMGRREAQRMGRQVHARVLDMFNAAESGRRRASQLLRHFPAMSPSGPGVQPYGAAPSGRGQPPPAAAAVGVIRAVSWADVEAALRRYGTYDSGWAVRHGRRVWAGRRVGHAWTWAALDTLTDKRHHAALTLCRECLLKLRLHCLRAGPARQREAVARREAGRRLLAKFSVFRPSAGLVHTYHATRRAVGMGLRYTRHFPLDPHTLSRARLLDAVEDGRPPAGGVVWADGVGAGAAAHRHMVEGADAVAAAAAPPAMALQVIFLWMSGVCDEESRRLAAWGEGEDEAVRPRAGKGGEPWRAHGFQCWELSAGESHLSGGDLEAWARARCAHGVSDPVGGGQEGGSLSSGSREGSFGGRLVGSGGSRDSGEGGGIGSCSGGGDSDSGSDSDACGVNSCGGSDGSGRGTSSGSSRGGDSGCGSGDCGSDGDSGDSDAGRDSGSGGSIGDGGGATSCRRSAISGGGGGRALARVRVWNGTDVDGPRAVARNWRAKAALARWRLQSACLDLTAAQIAARIRAGSVMVFSLYVHRLVVRNIADHRLADERKRDAERDLRRTWRNVAFAQYYDPDVRIGAEPAAGGAAPAPPLPAGCVRIDSALGEVPPDIFGQAFEVDISAKTRGRRRALGASAACAAAAAAQAERRNARASRRAARRGAQESHRRGLQPETRASVRSFHVKRLALCPPYDPYVDNTAVRGGGLWQDLEGAALQRSKVDREEARRALLVERDTRQREDRSGGRAWEACKRARQESVHLLSSPSGFRPMPAVGLVTRPKRRPPGGPVSRGAKLARRAE
jgi:hypothetical protein